MNAPHQVRKDALADGSAHWKVRSADGKEFPGSMAGRPERIRRVHELRKAGATIRDIAAELGCSTYTVQRDLEPDNGKAYSVGAGAAETQNARRGYRRAFADRDGPPVADR